ncbi:MAG: hypothetical protein ABEK00_01980 [Candidatus Nanohaloarchaea archaeon]
MGIGGGSSVDRGTVARPDTSPGSQVLEESESSSSAKTAAVVTALTTSGIIGRVALQHVPSVEPLIAVAAATGFYFGTREGIAAGASSYYISNFLVWGGQGPWTFFQALGAGAAGASGGLAGQIGEGRNAFLASTIVGVLAYEVVVNVSSFVFMPSGLSIAFLAASAPFVLTHLASTVGFGFMLYGAKDRIGLSG